MRRSSINRSGPGLEGLTAVGLTNILLHKVTLPRLERTCWGFVDIIHISYTRIDIVGHFNGK